MLSGVVSTGGNDLERVGFFDAYLLAGFEFQVLPFEDLTIIVPVGAHEVDGVVDDDRLVFLAGRLDFGRNLDGFPQDQVGG